MARGVSGESAALSRRSSGRAQASAPAASRPAPQKRGLAQSRRAIRPATPEDEEGEEEEQEEEEEEEDEEETGSVVDDDREARLKKSGLAREDLDRLVKNFVRYVLGCEYTRTQINRLDISRKVLEGKYPRAFQEVFRETQERLQSVFRMKLVELPAKEKRQTIQQQRRKDAQSAGKKSKATGGKQYILTSTLDTAFRQLPVLAEPEDETGLQYQGLVAMIVSLIYVNNGILPQESLMRYLRNLNIEDETPLMPTDKLLKQMEKQGYIVRERDHVADEARHDFLLGPRGKVEVGKEGAMDLVRNVFGEDWGPELKKRVERSMDELKEEGAQAEGEEQEEEQEIEEEPEPPATRRKRSRRDEDDDVEEGRQNTRGGRRRVS